MFRDVQHNDDELVLLTVIGAAGDDGSPSFVALLNNDVLEPLSSRYSAVLEEFIAGPEEVDVSDATKPDNHKLRALLHVLRTNFSVRGNAPETVQLDGCVRVVKKKVRMPEQ